MRSTLLRLPGWLAVLAALAWGPEAAAATKYVATTGSDANDGNSIATAYRTIAKGLKETGPAGRLYIGGGTYAEAILNTIPSGASESARTVVTNFEHEVVLIQPGPGPARVLEFSGGAAYITVAANGPRELILDGAQVSHNVVKFSAPAGGGAGAWPSHIRLENLEIRNGPDSGVLGFTRFCEFIRLTIHDAGSSVFDHGIYMEGTDNVIDGCEIYRNYARGIQIFMSGKQADPGFASRNTVRNCRIHDNGLTPGKLKPGIDADSGTENQIHDNLIYHNGQFGVLIQIGGAKNVVRNNTFFGNGTAAVLVKSSAGPANVVCDNLGVAQSDGAALLNERTDTEVTGNVWDCPASAFVSLHPADPGFLRPAGGAVAPQGAVGAHAAVK